MKSPKHMRTTTLARGFFAALSLVSLAFPQSAHAAGKVEIAFSPANFSDPLDIDNIFLPMVPGTTTIFKAEGADGCEEVHVTVTNDTKSIAGVTARVVEDVAYEDAACDGTLLKVEETLDWFAQDDAGNVWYLGEQTSDCDVSGCTPGPGAWEAGVDGAVAGIIMLADPKSGDQYYQEFYSGFAEDQAKIVGVEVRVSLRREDAYQPSELTGCLKTKEWTRLEPGAVEHKFYCPNIGLVAVDELHGKTLRFELVGPSSAFQFRIL